MTVLAYNGVTLPYSNVVDFKQEAVYDDLGGVDRILTRFDIQAQALVNKEYLSFLLPEVLQSANWTPADIVKVARIELLKPRRTLSVKFNGRELIPTPQRSNIGKGTTDARNGPLPQACVIIDMPNETFLIQYHIIAHYWENINADSQLQFEVVDGQLRPKQINENAGPVLYNRWSESVHIDDRNFTVKSREGKFMIRSDNTGGITPDELRSATAVLSIAPNFVRQSAHYTISPDGLAIQYRIVDRQVYVMPPVPAFRARGQYSESSPVGAEVRYAFCRVTLEGGPDVDRAKLLEAAVGMAGTNVVQTHIATIEYAESGVEMFENVAWCEIKAQLNAFKKTKGGISLTEFIARTPEEIPLTTTPPVMDYGSIYGSILLQAAAYNDPSILKNSLIPGTFNPLEGAFGPGVTANGVTDTGKKKVTNQGGSKHIEPGEGGVKRDT